MKKRVLCILMTAVWVLLLLPAPVRACEHFGPDAPLSSLKLTDFKMPTADEDGYSGDYHCPECGAIVVKGHILQALSGSLVHEQVIPDQPGKPETSEASGDPEKPAEPEEPAKPDKTKVTGKPKTTQKAKTTAKPKATEKTKATAKPKNTAKPKTAGKAGGKAAAESLQNSGAEGQTREPFSSLYPYRRVRMQPEEGIRAEAAGILIWPVPSSPFQRLLEQEHTPDTP